MCVTFQVSHRHTSAYHRHFINTRAFFVTKNIFGDYNLYTICGGRFECSTFIFWQNDGISKITTSNEPQASWVYSDVAPVLIGRTVSQKDGR